MKDPTSRQQLIEELTLAFQVALQSGEYKSPMFRSDHDVVLMSFGFHYTTSTGSTMYRNDPDGTKWLVVMEDPYPCFYRNDVKLGCLDYDTVINSVNQTKRNVG